MNCFIRLIISIVLSILISCSESNVIDELPLLPACNFEVSTQYLPQGEKISYYDLSQNTPESWVWSFGDGITSTLQNPEHIYNSSGVYNVSLVVSNRSGTDKMIKTNYITVVPLVAPEVDFSSENTMALVNQTVIFSDESSNYPTSWSWNFGDGVTSTLQNPEHVYTQPGNYNVTLLVKNAYGNDLEVKSDFISVGLSLQEIYSFESLDSYSNIKLVPGLKEWANKSIDNQQQAFIKFTSVVNGNLSFEYITSTQLNSDYLRIIINNESVFEISGDVEDNGSFCKYSTPVNIEDEIVIGYFKDSSGTDNLDLVCFRNVMIKN